MPQQPGQRPPQRPASRQPGQRPPQPRQPMPPKGPRAMQQPAAAGQRMAQAELDGAALPRRQAMPGQQPARSVDEAFRRPTASVDRPRYDFEDDGQYVPEEEQPRRRGGVLMPIVIALVVVGALLCGICLPDWEGMGGGVGGVLAPVKSTLVGAFTSVKNMIIPEIGRAHV